MPKNVVCRMNKTDKNPYCLKKPCWFKASGQCEGPLDTTPNRYSYLTCPADPDTGGRARSGDYEECNYCIDKDSIYCRHT